MAEPLNLFGRLVDEGLPRDARVTAGREVAGGSGTATFEDPRAARTRVVFSAPGAYDLEFSAGDSVLTNRTRVRVM